MLVYLWFILVSVVWLILGGLIVNDSGVYRPRTRKAKLIQLLIYGPALWYSLVFCAVWSIPIWLFKQLSKWIGDKLQKANRER